MHRKNKHTEETYRPHGEDLPMRGRKGYTHVEDIAVEYPEETYLWKVYTQWGPGHIHKRDIHT